MFWLALEATRLPHAIQQLGRNHYFVFFLALIKSREKKMKTSASGQQMCIGYFNLYWCIFGLKK
jgi:hypothetical protein